MPFWTLVIHCQTWTPTTGGIDHTSTRATVTSSRTQVETRTSSSAISIPSPIVSPTLTSREEDRADQRVPEDRVAEDAREVRQPDVDAVVLDQLEQPVLLERELDQVDDRVAEYRPDRQQHRARAAGTAWRHVSDGDA